MVVKTENAQIKQKLRIMASKTEAETEQQQSSQHVSCHAE